MPDLARVLLLNFTLFSFLPALPPQPPPLRILPSPSPLFERLNMVCHLCQATGHTQRSCLMKKTCCLLSLPKDNPLRPAVPATTKCTVALCAHHFKCPRCGEDSHEADTLALLADRWVINPRIKGQSISRRPDVGPLRGCDFVCKLIDEERAADICEGVMAGYFARAQTKTVAAASVATLSDQLSGNAVREQLDPVQTVDLLARSGSKASTLHGVNREAHDIAARLRKQGSSAVDAAVAAARQIGPHVQGGAHSEVAPQSAHGLTAAARARKRSRTENLAEKLLTARKEAAPALPIAACPSAAVPAVLADPAWPAGERAKFETTLPVIPVSRRLSLSPTQVAELALWAMFGVDHGTHHGTLSNQILGCAASSHLTGLALTSGAFSPAKIAERLCSWPVQEGDLLSKSTLLLMVAAWARDYVMSLL